MKLYHWTSLENSKLIDKEGLKLGLPTNRNSCGITKFIYLCRKPDVWHGEVCYEVNVARHEGFKLSMPFNDWEILCWNDIPIKIIKKIYKELI